MAKTTAKTTKTTKTTKAAPKVSAKSAAASAMKAQPANSNRVRLTPEGFEEKKAELEKLLSQISEEPVSLAI